MITKQSLEYNFKIKFNQKVDLMIKSPGRINILGEHTDYNDGFVLPAAIDKHIYVAISKREDTEINLYSADYSTYYKTNITQIDLEAPQWAKYITGVSTLISKRTNRITGFNLYFAGDIPPGAGLSSSAALCSAVGFALNELFTLGLTKIELARIGQQTEHDFIGVKCGIMDQYTTLFGEEDKAIILDCKNLKHETISIPLYDYELLLINSNVKHNLAASAYNERRNSCLKGVKLIQKHIESAQSLRDVNLDHLDQYVKNIDFDSYTKCRYVIEENQRVKLAIDYIYDNNIQEVGKLLFETHRGLSKDYEVSCLELDYLVTLSEESFHCIGARMMGGGFGGCSINIIKKGQSLSFINELRLKYKNKFKKNLTAIPIKIGQGTCIIS